MGSRRRLPRRVALLVVPAVLAASLGVTVWLTRYRGDGDPKGSPKVAGNAAKDTARPSGPRRRQPYDDHLRRSIRSIEAFWREESPRVYDIEYEPLQGGLFGYTAKSKIPSCGGQRLPYLLVQGNAFYCEEDDFVAWDDQQLFPRLAGESGNLLLSVVLAHEWGHVIQSRVEDIDAFLAGALTELQADCFAGAWVRWARGEGRRLLPVSDAALDRVLAGYVAFRDRPGVSADDPGAHGSAFDRLGSFRRGLLDGPGRCATYDDDPPELVQVPFVDLKDRFRGGNAPFDEVMPLTVASLAAFFGDNPPVRRSDAPRLGPLCRGRPTVVKGAASAVQYCPADDTLRWSARVMRRIYDRYGDFAVATLMAHARARREQVAAGTTGEDVRTRLAADCVAGAWAGAAFRGEAGRIQLTAGDLDEAIATLLEVRNEDGDAAGGVFERVDAYQRGFERGRGACP